MTKVTTSERPDLPVGLIVNRARSPREAHELHAKFDEIATRFLGISIDRVGYILEDLEVERATRNQNPLMVSAPQSEAARCLAKLGAQLAAELESSDRGQPGLFAGLMARITEQELA